jgi:hypothetical protein
MPASALEPLIFEVRALISDGDIDAAFERLSTTESQCHDREFLRITYGDDSR